MSENGQKITNEKVAGAFESDTSYDAHAMRLQDEYESDADTLISRPAAAYTNSPYLFERHPVLPCPTEEITPPPSPIIRAGSPSKSSTSGSYFSAASVRFGPLISNAGSILGTSPPKSDNPTDSRTSVATGANSPSRKSKSSFADLFQAQGGSAPMNIGFLGSPKKETVPRPGSPHKSARSESMVGVSAGSPARPGHERRGSTLKAAASFFGLATPSPRTHSRSPIRRPVLVDENDAILNLDLEDELFPATNAGVAKATAIDEFLENAEKLFSRVRSAYREKCRELEEERAGRAGDKEALLEEQTRVEHFKTQVAQMGACVNEKEAEIASLQEELEERDRRARSIRMVASPNRHSLDRLEDGERLFSLGLEEDSSDSESGDESSNDSVFERPNSRSTNATEADMAQMRGRHPYAHEQRQSLAWQHAAPFLPPETKLAEENGELRKRIAELEETVNGCLGLVDM